MRTIPLVAATLSAPTLQLLSWITERPRTYAQTIEAWQSHCPRLTVWEDAIADGYVTVGRDGVRLSAEGHAVLKASSRAS